MITRLEKSGLGYHVHHNVTTDRFGKIPMRHLVYRVHPLPRSLLYVVCDFGSLSAAVEKLYISQIVKGKIKVSIHLI